MNEETTRLTFEILYKQLKEDNIQKVRDNFNKLSSRIGEVSGRFKRMQESMYIMNQSFAKNSPTMKLFNKQYEQTSNELRKLIPMQRKNIMLLTKHGIELNRIARNSKKFKMEMLGVMFFGQMLARTSEGLLKPAAEAVGIFDLWGTTLQVLFLPTILQLLDPFISFATWLMNLSDPIKLLIGDLVLLTAVIGTVLGTIGAWSLGKSSVEMWLSNVGVGFDTVNAKLNSFSSTWIGKVVGAGIIIKFGIDWYQDMNTIFNKKGLELVDLFKVMLDAFMVGIGLALLSGSFSAAAPITIPLALLITVALLDFKMIDESGAKDKAMAAAKDVWSNVKSGWDTIWGEGSFESKTITVGGKLINIFNAPGDYLTGKGGSIGSSTIGGKPASYDETIAARDAAKKKYSGTKYLDDMIWRPGQAPVSIAPDDTLIAKKGGDSSFGGGGVIINQTIHVTANNREEISRLIADNNKRLVDDVKRMVGA